MNRIDVVIFSAEKDYNKIRFVYDSLRYIKDVIDNIYIITPNTLDEKYKINSNKIIYCNDHDVLNFDRSIIKHRPNWIAQQYMKLFQSITANDNYLVIDSDVVLNSDINFIEEDKNVFYIGRDQFHPPYFEFSKKMIGLDKVYNHSFINEIMLFSKSVVKNILIENNFTDVYDFINKSSMIINDKCYISEFELYGNYVYRNYNDLYIIKKINTILQGKNGIWSEHEINSVINHFKNDKNNSIISFHSWD